MEYQIEVIAHESCFEGFLRVARYRVRHSLFAGGWSRPIMRERIERMRAAAAILYDPGSDQVVMVEQFRIGALEEGPGAWTLEPVGGVLGDGEDPEEVVRREAREEAGCEIGPLETIGTYHVNPATTADKVRLFCGCVTAPPEDGVYGLDSEDEETRVAVIAANQAIHGLFSGRLGTASAIIAIQWLAMNRERIRKVWLP
jgi:ADP-ribose pyrophosphatase